MSCWTVIWHLSVCEMPSFAEARQALMPPAPNDAVAPGHKAPAQGDKGFNFLAKTDDSFDKNRHGVVGAVQQSLLLALSSSLLHVYLSW